MKISLVIIAGLCFQQLNIYGNQINHRTLAIYTSTDTTLPQRTYEEILLKFKNGERDQSFLYKAALIAKDEKDEKNAKLIATEYIKRLHNPYTVDNLKFIKRFTVHTSDLGFKYFTTDSIKVDSVLGKNTSYSKIKYILYKDYIEPFVQDDTTIKDWEKIKKGITKKYGKVGEDIALRSMVLFYFNKKDWISFSKCAIPYIDKYSFNIAAFELNNFAWVVFENINDEKILSKALSWSKLTLAEGDFPNTLDTYANLLYKLGKSAEAIPFEEKAVNIAPESMKDAYRLTLEKMRKGEPTWN